MRNLIAGAFVAAFGAAAFPPAAPAQSLPVEVGQDHETAVAALKKKGIAFAESAAGENRTIRYSEGSESVVLDFTPWPKDPKAPASAWEKGSSAPKQMTLTRIQDSAPSSEARRAWVNTFAREGQGWAYLGSQENRARSVEDQTKFPVAAGLEWKTPAARLLFQAARPAGTPPGNEATVLVIDLINPHLPRRS
jgi:hypothetical protein